MHDFSNLRTRSYLEGFTNESFYATQGHGALFDALVDLYKDPRMANVLFTEEGSKAVLDALH
jgi:hypothetical protein